MKHLHLEWPSTPDKTPGHPRRIFVVPGWGGGSCPPSNLSSKQEAAPTVLNGGEQITLKFGCDVPGDDPIHTSMGSLPSHMEGYGNGFTSKHESLL